MLTKLCQSMPLCQGKQKLQNLFVVRLREKARKYAYGALYAHSQPEKIAQSVICAYL